MVKCTWPRGTCEHYDAKMATEKMPDRLGRVWMHCEEGLSMSKASMGRFVFFCLSNQVEIGEILAFNPRYPNCQVSTTVRLRPDQFSDFQNETKGRLRKPPKISLNGGAAQDRRE